MIPLFMIEARAEWDRGEYRLLVREADKDAALRTFGLTFGLMDEDDNPLTTVDEIRELLRDRTSFEAYRIFVVNEKTQGALPWFDEDGLLCVEAEGEWGV
jgi:hypothetical protein